MMRALTGGVLWIGFPAMVWAACIAGDPVDLSPNLVTSVFGKTRSLDIYKEPHVHWGTDFQARDPVDRSRGAKLLAPEEATVVGAGFWGNGYGNRVVLKRDDGSLLTFNHLSVVNPDYKSGSGIGFSSQTAGDAVGTKRAPKGAELGRAGGTGAREGGNDYAIHLHMEYITGYGGVKVRETNGSIQAKSRYYQNPEAAFCRVFQRTADAGPPPDKSSGLGGTTIVSSETGAVSQKASSAQTGGAGAATAASAEQAALAAKTQPTVSDRERFGYPDAAPYPTYGAASESQLIEAESLRRALDTEWDVRLAKMSSHGLWVEIDRLDASLLFLRRAMDNQRQRMEGLYATMLAKQTERVSDVRMRVAKARIQRVAQASKVKSEE